MAECTGNALLVQKAQRICDELEGLYPNAACSLDYKKPHELMIAARLSAQCTDARVNTVTKELFAKYRSIEDFAGADVCDIERIIKPCGMYRTKAMSVVQMCQRLTEDFGGEIPSTLEQLTSLPGIGRKTANLIMGDVFHKPAVVTDTHCIRISRRLGLTTSDDPKKTEAELRQLLAPERSSDFCHRLVLFGRDICRARKPECGRCPFAKELCCAAKDTERT